MTLINENYANLKGSYLFTEIAKRVKSFNETNPDAGIIRLGIGDVTRPLAPAIISALHAAVDEMASAQTFHGYGPETGYPFLAEKIAQHDYQARGVGIEADEIFISDGAKSDCANFQEIFDTNCTVALTDPVYPVYVDSNVMAGRSGEMKDGRYENFVYLPCTAENNFEPALPNENVDLIYLCYPNNPTGAVITKDALKKWVDYAREHKAIILYDAAYEAFIRDDEIPRSIFEIEGAKEVAVEFRSFSKTAGFTGTRCAFTVVPKEARGFNRAGEAMELHPMWFRRQSTKFNGAPYIIQKGAEAVYSDQGKKQVRADIDYYMENARLIREGVASVGLNVFGGQNAPYIWLKVPSGDSWTFFDKLLNEANVVGTPGSGFGPSGEGYFRLTAFGSRENTQEAVERIRTRLKL